MGVENSRHKTPLHVSALSALSVKWCHLLLCSDIIWSAVKLNWWGNFYRNLSSAHHVSLFSGPLSSRKRVEKLMLACDLPNCTFFVCETGNARFSRVTLPQENGFSISGEHLFSFFDFNAMLFIWSIAIHRSRAYCQKMINCWKYDPKYVITFSISCPCLCVSLGQFNFSGLFLSRPCLYFTYIQLTSIYWRHMDTELPLVYLGWEKRGSTCNFIVISFGLGKFVHRPQFSSRKKINNRLRRPACFVF